MNLMLFMALKPDIRIYREQLCNSMVQEVGGARGKSAEHPGSELCFCPQTRFKILLREGQ